MANRQPDQRRSTARQKPVGETEQQQASHQGFLAEPGSEAWNQAMAECVATREAARSREEAAKVYQLAFWPDSKRSMPHDFIACALFAAIQVKDAEYYDGLEIANANDLRIVFKGKRLTQVHADVWMGIMHLARELPQGSKIQFRARQFLKIIGRQTGKKQRDDLKNWFSDLTATSVEITDSKNSKCYWGSLLPQGASGLEGQDSVYVVEVNRQLARLFARNLGEVDWQVRQRLFRKPLALWWQFYSSRFRKPVAVAELHRLSGSGSSLKEFRRKLRHAMATVEAAGGLAAHVVSETDIAVVQATPSRVFTTEKRSALLPAPVFVSEDTKRDFHKLYPGKDLDRCLLDWQTWLARTGRGAKRPNSAFLGFAKRWVAQH